MNEINTYDQVITFIDNFVTHMGKFNDECMGTITSHFRSGYCWHFAHMLKDVFERGEVCWAAPFGHFVWVDEDNIPYDIEGEYFGEAFYFIPESYVVRYLPGFKHLDTTPAQIATAEDLTSVMKRFCHDKKYEYNPEVEKYYAHPECLTRGEVIDE